MWDLSCPDWRERLAAGRPLVPELPLFAGEAADGLAAFDECRLPDTLTPPGERPPRLGDAAGRWFRDIVRAAFGSWDPVANIRWIRDIFCLAPKGSSKTTYSAGFILALLWLNRRPNCQGIFVGPTQAISSRAYDQTVGMIELEPAFKKRFKPIDHEKTILDLVLNVEVKVRTFDVNILTGEILIFALLDELHLLGRNVHTGKVLRQIRGGLDKTPEGLLLITTTQSDEPPIGAFRDELYHARKVRDGEFKGRTIRPLLPVLYEFPEPIARDPARWQDPVNWPMIMPNLGRSVHLRDLQPDWETEKSKGEHAARIWASQHLNIQIGIGLRTDAWPGARYWERRTDPVLTLDELLDRSEVVTVGVDGGGLDDLLGLGVIGRCKTTKHWLAWCHAWCHEGVLEERKSIAQHLRDFAAAGDLTIVGANLLADQLYAAMRQASKRAREAGAPGWLAEDRAAIEALRAEIRDHGFPDDIRELVDIVVRVKRLGLLAEVGADPAGLGLIVDGLAEERCDVTEENGLLFGVGQGYRLMNAIKTAERRLENGTLWHAPSRLMDWCVGNVKIEPTATAIRATKQNAGDAKIDPWCAMIDAVDRMSLNPAARAPQMFFLGTRRTAAAQRRAA